MTDHVSRFAIVTLAVISWCGTPAGAQTAPAVFAKERSLADRPGVQQRGSWLFSTAIESASEGAKRIRSQQHTRVRFQAELQFRTAVLDRAGVPAHVPESLLPTLGALAWASTGRSFDLSGVQEVDSRETADGGYRVVLALPRRDDVGSVTFASVVSFLEKDAAKERPEQDPLLLLEVLADPEPAVPRVVAAMGRLYGPGMVDALSGRKPAWTSLPAWARESPRALTERDCKDTPGRDLLKLIAARPEDVTPRRVLAERMKATGLHRIANVFMQELPTLEWKPLDEEDQQAIRDVAALSRFLDTKCNWLELLVRTGGRLPWKNQAACAIEPAKALFAKGDVKAAGLQLLKTLESRSCPEAMSYLSSVCHEAKAHRLGARLARWASDAQPSLPFAAINEIRNLMQLNDRAAVRARLDAVTTRRNLTTWEQTELERAIRWLMESPTPPR